MVGSWRGREELRNADRGRGGGWVSCLDARRRDCEGWREVLRRGGVSGGKGARRRARKKRSSKGTGGSTPPREKTT